MCISPWISSNQQYSSVIAGKDCKVGNRRGKQVGATGYQIQEGGVLSIES